MPDVSQLSFRVYPSGQSIYRAGRRKIFKTTLIEFSAKAYQANGTGWTFESSSEIDDRFIANVLERAKTDVELAKKIRALIR